MRLRAALTEIGTLELFCVAEDRDARWKLEFGLRGEGDGPEARAALGAPRRSPRRRRWSSLYFGKRAAVERRDVKGCPGRWRRCWAAGGLDDPVLRELWAALHAGAGGAGAARTTSGSGSSSPATPPPRLRRAARRLAGGRDLRVSARGCSSRPSRTTGRPGGCSGGASPAASTPRQERVFDAVAPSCRRATRAAPGPSRGREGGGARRADPAGREPGAGSARAEAGGRGLLERLDARGRAAPPLGAGPSGRARPVPRERAPGGPGGRGRGVVRRLLRLAAPPGVLVFPLSQLARRSGDRARDLDVAREEVAAALIRGPAPAEVV